MAIVEMKRLSLLAMRRDQEKIVRALQKMGSVQISEPGEDFKDFLPPDESASAMESQRRLKWAISRLQAYDTEKTPVFGLRREIEESDAQRVYAERDKCFQVVRALEDEERRIGELSALEARIDAERGQLTPYEKLDAPLSELADTRFTFLALGLLPSRALQKARELFAEKGAALEVLSEGREGAAILGAGLKRDMDEITRALKEMGFSAAQLQNVKGGLVIDRLRELDREKEDCARERAAMTDNRKSLAASLPDMKALYDMLTFERDRAEARRRFIETGSVFCLEGWTPAHLTETIEKKLKAISPLVQLEFRDPTDDEEPPILLHNNKISTPFEPVVEGFAMPAYRGIDPTAVMAPFYACLFGMMVSDAGYGIVLTLAIPLFIKIKKIKFENARMLWLLAIGGLFTVLWGALYNTWFGFAPWPSLFDPINNSLPVMALCIGVGALHLFTGLGVAAYMNIKRKKPLDAVYDQLSWILLLCGLGMLLLPATAQIGKIMAIAGAGIILLTAGRDKKNPFKRLIGGLGKLYGITSWVSDLLSYMRLFGMGLATGVIGMVINILIGMLFSGGIIGKVIGVPLFVFAHLFNMAINVLGAYVHSCRLQYIEFFGKFYEEGGKPFRPLRNNARYVSVRPQGE